MISLTLKAMGTAANAESRRTLRRWPNSRMATSSESSAPAPPMDANTSKKVLVTICTVPPPAARDAALAAVPGTNTLCATPSSMLPPWMPKNHMTLFAKRYRRPLPSDASARGEKGAHACEEQLLDASRRKDDGRGRVEGGAERHHGSDGHERRDRLIEHAVHAVAVTAAGGQAAYDAAVEHGRAEPAYDGDEQGTRAEHGQIDGAPSRTPRALGSPPVRRRARLG